MKKSLFFYEYRPSKQEILVCFLNENCEQYYPTLAQDLEHMAEKHEFQLISYSGFKENYNLEKNKNYVIKHMIIVSDSENPAQLTEKYQDLLTDFDSISIAMVYSSQDAMLRQKDVVEGLKLKFKDRVNYLRPDTQGQSKYFVSNMKIIDNAVCDTIRIKYKPSRLSENMPILTDELTYYFKKVCALYMEHHLYHRSQTDGFFAVKTDQGIYVTCTKTDKSFFDPNRISLVTDYDETTNLLSYRGKYLPSSDVVEAFIVFKKNPSVKAIMHTHASEAFTRNPAYSHKIKVPKSSYGIPEVGHAISCAVEKSPDDFLIVEEHGEYFTSTLDPMSAADSFENIILNEKAKTLGSDIAVKNSQTLSY